MTNSLQTKPIHQDLAKDLAISAQQLVILQLLSLAYLQISKSQLLQCLNQFHILEQAPVVIDNETFQQDIDTLIKVGYIQVQSSKLYCEMVCAEKVLRYLKKYPDKATYFTTIKMVFKIADYKYGYFVRHFSEGVRDLRLALYAEKYEDFSKLAQTIQSYFSNEWRNRNPYLNIFDNPFDADLFDSLPNDISLTIAATILAIRVNRLENCVAPLAWLRDRAKLAKEEQRAWFAAVLCEPMVLRGHIDEAVALSKSKKSPELPTPIEGLAGVLKGDFTHAQLIFDSYLKEAKKGIDLRKLGMAGLSGASYVISLITSSDPKKVEKATAHIGSVMKTGSSMLSVYAALGRTARASSTLVARKVDERVDISERDSLGLLFHSLELWWIDGSTDVIDRDRIRELALKAEKNGYRWVAAEANTLLGNMDSEIHNDKGHKLHYELGTKSLLNAVRRQPMWERALSALEKFGSDFTNISSQIKSSRFIWHLTYQDNGARCLLEAREQKRVGSGAWGTSRAVSINRLLTVQQEIDGLSEQDRAVIAMIRVAENNAKSTNKKLDFLPALSLLVGHPLLFWSNKSNEQVTLVKSYPEINVSLDNQHICIQITPTFSEGERFKLIRETKNRLRIIEAHPDHEKLLNIIDQNGLVVPLSMEERVKLILDSLSNKLVVRSQIGKGNISIQADHFQLYILLSPAATGLNVELIVMPDGEKGTIFTPGLGLEYIDSHHSTEGDKFQIKRNLSQEVDAAEEVFKQCRPWLKEVDETLFTGTTPHVSAACELLITLKEFGERVQLRWPEGETIKISGEADASQLSLSVTSQGDWLGVNGQLVIDQDNVIELKDLLQASAVQESRFVPLKNGQYIALSEQLLKRVKDLDGLSEKDTHEIRIHALAATELSKVVNLTESTQTDTGWRHLLEQRDSLTQWYPVLPDSLQAELRDYQLVGFEWLARHAKAGSGACLADDMGLGKTLQTLTLLLHRASDGPALVIAPTSVCGNWLSEAQRFAPSLNIRWLGTSSKDKFYLEAGPGDLIIMSYTLFQQEGESLAQKRWSTVVLDEAQAIKNSGTKRSQAAMKLNAHFRLITTGTPIENHLGELWNLFRFINPGLLGSHDSFNDRFAIPIEKNNDSEARERLRRLIQPFILRRTKSQVLSELPPRTEVTITLDLSPEERSMYEAVRQEALEKATPTNDDHPNRIRVLAGIMKLRRACCHGALILPQLSWQSVKINALVEIIEELKDSGHRALIFSQFVDFLSLIKQAMEEKGVSYLYLDGSTSVQDRVKRVKAFQEGEGDVFLISLKAGGVGLNLTAADYVIHMDPWWNPAVEDQASDRAHRMGQTRPVTIYRLVTKDTIEEKIVALHERKRNLADSLLEGAGEVSSISTEELIRLLQEEPLK
ncbi:RNA polymerase-associated protein RapA [Ferrovum sp. JA12]|uniref:DEAD/DEAH box helicase n=1 Tax=Ferrovum sp. JA12 TaxID=1356299 RepID=UPI0007032A42|nr:DEAD/DEAH box helicase [Ferrovum sp. JA12]KRH78660.1 RNA polymerase-associated protein RapA [Ferrovum sp. JA12]